MARVRKKAKIGRLELEVMEWVAIGIAFLGLVAIFCIFFIRRHVLEYHLEHTYGVSDPEFFGSALALSDPVPLAGNKIELLQNGDESFPAMLAAIRGAKKTLNFEAYIVYSDEIGPDVPRCTDRTRPGRGRGASPPRRPRFGLESG